MDETMTARTDVEGTRLAHPRARIAVRCAVGYDGSAASVTALGWAAARAVRSGGEVQLVGVVDDDSGAMGAAYARQSAHDLGALLSAAAARVASAHPGLAVTTRLVTGA
ncbi:universal stress protein, partial [Clavibacter michiganensis]